MGSEAPSIPLSPVLATPVKRLSAVPAQPELESPAEVVSDFQRERMEMLDLRGSPPSAGVSVCQAGRQIPRPDQSGDQGWQAADAEHGQPCSTDSRMAARSIQERTGAGGVPAAPDIDDGLFQGSRHSIYSVLTPLPVNHDERLLRSGGFRTRSAAQSASSSEEEEGYQVR